jgi:hypothetical protein
VVLLIIVSALVNVGLGFALAMYAARRYQLTAVGGTVFSPGAAGGEGLSAGAEAAGIPAGPPETAETDAASVEGLQKKVEQYHQQLADVEAKLSTK